MGDRLWRSLAAWGIGFAAATAGFLAPAAAMAETLSGALVRAYNNNPDINQQRAAVRAADEEVPKASAGFRPRIDAEVDTQLEQFRKTTSPFIGPPTDVESYPLGFSRPTGFDVAARQYLWDGDHTLNLVREAQSKDMAAREQLRNTEQNVLLEGVAVYMNVMRDVAILDLQRAHVRLLEEQFDDAHERHRVGDVTQTEVAEVAADLAGAQAASYSAESTLTASIADYRRTIGVEPKALAPAKALDEPLPKSLDRAIAISQVEHPAIVGALYGVDAAALDVNVIESRLYPTVELKARVDRRYNAATAAIPTIPFIASLTTKANVPIYDGGLTFASTRQAKETLDQRGFQADQQRDRVRAGVVSVWGRNQSAASIVAATRELIAAAAAVLEDIRYQHKLGQRTILDVLVAQENLLRARIQLVSAQRDEVVSSYDLLSRVGRLSLNGLRLTATPYDPKVHFDQVKDKWFGLRTPDGR
jgi:outer membrane protein